MKRLLGALLAVLLIATPVAAADGDTIGGTLSVGPYSTYVQSLGNAAAVVTLTTAAPGVALPAAVILLPGQSFTARYGYTCGWDFRAHFRLADGTGGSATLSTRLPCPTKRYDYALRMWVIDPTLPTQVPAP